MTDSDAFLSRGGELYEMLADRVGGFQLHNRIIDNARMCRDRGPYHETVCRAVRGGRAKGFPGGRLTVDVAIRLMDLSRNSEDARPVYADDILKFMIPNFDSYMHPASTLLS